MDALEASETTVTSARNGLTQNGEPVSYLVLG